LGIIALVAPMLFYIRGYFGDGDLRHQDTVFKFGLQAWLLLGTAAACGALSLLRDLPANARRIGQLALASLWTIPMVCALCVLWSRGVRDAERDESGNTIFSLDGARHLPPDDRIALDWLSRHALPGDVVLEAKPPGMGLGSYSAFARVSALSGVPTPLGWSQHVWFWGADPNVDIPPRQIDIDTVFNWRDDTAARDALERLKVKYIFVGQLERETYNAGGLAKLREKLNVVQESGETFVGTVKP